MAMCLSKLPELVMGWEAQAVGLQSMRSELTVTEWLS